MFSSWSSPMDAIFSFLSCYVINARACATSKKEKSLFMPPKRNTKNFFSLFRLVCVFSPPTCLKKMEKQKIKFLDHKKEEKNRHFFFPKSCPPHPFSYLQTKLFFLEREREREKETSSAPARLFFSLSVCVSFRDSIGERASFWERERERFVCLLNFFS